MSDLTYAVTEYLGTLPLLSLLLSAFTDQNPSQSQGPTESQVSADLSESFESSL